MAQAILGSLQAKTPEQEEAERRAEALRVAQLSPEQQSTYQHQVNQGFINQGIKGAVGGALGVDVRSADAKKRDAIERVKAQVQASGIDPENLDSFYVAVIKALGAEGFAAEAAEVAREYQAQKLARQKGEVELREQRRKEAKDVATSEQAVERNAIARARLGASAPETEKLLNLLDRTTEPNARKAITARLNALAAGKVIFNDLGDRVQMIDPTTKEVLRTDVKGAAPETGGAKAKREAKDVGRGSAYNEIMAGLQNRYDAVVDLYNHPGVAGITGATGRFVGEKTSEGETTLGRIATTVAGKDSRAALALFERVQGGAFLAGLERLKAASKTGSTGLGAVSEKEGDKVQSDAAAISRAQDAVDFRAALAIYARSMEAAAGRIAADAQTYSVEAPALEAHALVAPGLRGKAAPAAPAPAVKAAPAAPAADRVRVQSPDGQTGTIPRSQLEEAKAAGYTEVK